jgi:F-type H+-transporting ATPase subunit a
VEDKFAVSLRAEPVIHIGDFVITNSMLTMVIVGALLVILMISGLGNAKLVPNRWQALWEFILESLLNIVEGSVGRKAGRALFPLLATFFIYILLANWFSLLPGVGSIGYYEGDISVPTDKTLNVTDPATTYAVTNSAVPVTDASGKSLGEFEGTTTVKILERQAQQARVQAVNSTGEEAGKPIEGKPEGFVPLNQLTGAQEYRVLIPFLRAPNADLNMTLAMALIAIVLVQIIAVRSHGLSGYIKEFFPKPHWLDPLLTPLEIVQQFARLISLTVRLFGNVFAGEALLAIILKIAAPTLFIFIGLEMFFGLIQALVFFSLSTVYLTLAVLGMDGGHGTDEHEAHHDEGEHDSHLTEQARYPQQSETVEKEAVGAAR